MNAKKDGRNILHECKDRWKKQCVIPLFYVSLRVIPMIVLSTMILQSRVHKNIEKRKKLVFGVRLAYVYLNIIAKLRHG